MQVLGGSPTSTSSRLPSRTNHAHHCFDATGCDRTPGPMLHLLPALPAAPAACGGSSAHQGVGELQQRGWQLRQSCQPQRPPGYPGRRRQPQRRWPQPLWRRPQSGSCCLLGGSQGIGGWLAEGAGTWAGETKGRQWELVWHGKILDNSTRHVGQQGVRVWLTAGRRRLSSRGRGGSRGSSRSSGRGSGGRRGRRRRGSHHCTTGEGCSGLNR